MNDRPLFFIQDYSFPLATWGYGDVLARGWMKINVFSYGSGGVQLQEQMHEAAFCKFVQDSLRGTEGRIKLIV